MTAQTRPAVADHVLKRRQLGPTLEAQLTTPAGPQDLTGATVTFEMAHENGAIARAAGVVSIVNAEEGRVAYSWQSPDTDVAGWYRAEFHIVNLNPSPVRWPSRGPIWIEIQDVVGTG